MNRLLSTLLLTGLITGSLSTASADPGKIRDGESDWGGKYCNKHRMQGGGEELRLERMAEHLGLSDEQLARVRAIFDKYRPEQRTLRDRMRENHKQLREQMHQETPDQARIEKLAKAQGDLKAQMIMLKGKIHAEMNKVLTAEQRKQMQERREAYGMGRGMPDRD